MRALLALSLLTIGDLVTPILDAQTLDLGGSVGIAGQDAELVADLDPASMPTGSPSRDWVRAGGLLFFLRRLDAETSLWRTDGTAAGTLRIRDFGTASGTSSLPGSELPDGRLLFAIHDPAQGQELWVSDGTTSGTRLFADICPGLCSSFPGGPSGFARFGDEIFFNAAVGRAPKLRLFATDGGAGSLRQASDLDVERWTATEAHLFILEKTDSWTLWVSDGVPGSEAEVRALEIEFVWAFLPFRGGVLLIARSSSGGNLELYFGDEQEFRRIATLPAGPGFRAAVAGAELAYVVFDDRLLRTDGTSAGTFELEAVAADGGQPRPGMVLVDERMFFVSDAPLHGMELWTSDGTQTGTALVKDILEGSQGSRPNRLTAFDSQLFFFADEELEGEASPGLWRSDGTSGGTRRILPHLQTVDRDFSGAAPFGVLDDRFYFAAGSGDSGLEPWSSDGTAEGTDLLINLWPDEASSEPRSFVARTEDVIFVADTGVPGTEFFRAIRDGTVELAFVSEGSAFVLGEAGPRILFETRQSPLSGPTHVFALEPETGFVEEVLEVPRVFRAVAVGDRLYLVTGRQIPSGSLPEELWVTDGTPEATTRLVPVDGDLPRTPDNPVAWRGDLYFRAFTPAAGSELWRTDGTPQGTRLALDFRPGPDSSVPFLLAAPADGIYLRATLGVHFRPLVVTDGTPGGTRAVDVGDHGPQSQAAALGNRLLWIEGFDLKDLWISDGSPEGTRLLRSFERAGSLTRSGGQAFFSAMTREHGVELWATDGTVAGTRLVLDAEPGPESSEPSRLLDVDGLLLFAARTAASGNEPWVSNGLPRGTRRLADVAPGVAGSGPRHFTALRDRLLFSARRDDVGRELFAIQRSTLTGLCIADESSLCLGGDRFRVEVDWRDFTGDTGNGKVAPPGSEDSGLFYFFDPDNWEVLVKVLDGCGFNDRWWVFSAATTNVEYTLRVTDTATGAIREYFNALGNAAPAITDTEAFMACPRERGGRSTPLPARAR